jgi:siroheme synthase (precorrin-2 oxidase/ferrochelatase)
VPEVNAAVYRRRLERGIPCNSVDDIPNCDFFFGSVVSRGDLQIAISTAGESPAVAQRLRREIDEQLAADLGPWLANLGEAAPRSPRHPSPQRRAPLCSTNSHSAQICDSPPCSTRQLAPVMARPGKRRESKDLRAFAGQVRSLSAQAPAIPNCSP